MTAIEVHHEPVHAERETAEAPPAPEVGRRIVVLGPKGGVGRTTIATNLAVALAGRGAEVGLLDLDLAFGDVATVLLLDPRSGLSRLAAAPRPLPAASVRSLLVRHQSGAQVLLAPDSPAEAEAFSSEDVGDVLDGVDDGLSHLVVDTAAGLDAACLSAVERATELVLVTTLDVTAVLALRNALDVLDRLGMRAPRRHVVVNRDGVAAGITADDVAGTLGLPVAVRIPESPQLTLAGNEGRPFVTGAPRSPVAKAVQSLADRFDEAPPVAPSRRRRRWRAG